MTLKLHLTRTLLFITLALVLSGCSGSQPPISDDLQTSFQQIIPDTELNKDLRIKIADQKKARLTKDFKIYLWNASDEPIYLDPQQPFRLFIADGNQWVEIDNRDLYVSLPDEDGILIEPEKSGIGPWTPRVCPALMPSQEIEGDEVALRILAIGETMSNGERTGTQVGATLDVLLEINP